ncbi:signal recognition particle subunit srp68 [Paecilomyces lecythidis]
MEITDFIYSRRQQAFLVGDYNTYRAQTTRRLHTVRKKLAQTTPKGRKYTAKPPVTAEDVAGNVLYVHLLLLSAERAWANAMYMKSVHSADPSAKGIAGATRRHIITRLHKASVYATQLVTVLQDRSASHASDIDLLEARAYLASIAGALWFEKQKWEESIRNFSIARVIYTLLGQKDKKDAYRELLSGTIDPSIRYAAYQLKLPRSRAVPSLAIEFFPSSGETRAEVEKIDPACLSEEGVGAKRTTDGEIQKLPESITWRNRTVPIEDASISQALAATSAAESRLSAWLADAGKSALPKDKAAAYDNVISASQDAVDATKAAIDELAAEGVELGDKRMQSLQITRTAVNYALIGWRVGRNRVLCGDQDGLYFDSEQVRASKKSKDGVKREERTGKKLSKLREKVALYDSTLQNLDIVQELPGVAGDADFVRELDGKRSYFQALRCLAIGRSHSFLEKPKNALALFARALDLASSALSTQQGPSKADGPPRLDIPSPQIQAVGSVLRGLVAQYRGLVTLERLSGSETTGSAGPSSVLEFMNEYTADTLDLNHVVPYPPKMQPIPVKPLFLDVAFNYIDYPREGAAAPRQTAPESPAPEEKKEGRRGWFGFGR